MVYLVIMFGGALGSLARYLLSGVIQDHTPGRFPLGILVINVLGSFILAFVTTLGLRGLIAENVRLAIGTGFVGAFTTFSTFEWDIDVLIREGKFLQATLYVTGNVVLGFLAVHLGRFAARGVGGCP